MSKSTTSIQLSRDEALARLAGLRAQSAQLGSDMAALQDDFVMAAKTMQADLQQLTALVAAQMGAGGEAPTPAGTVGAGAGAVGAGTGHGDARPVIADDELMAAVEETLAMAPETSKREMLARLRVDYQVSENRVKKAMRAVRDRSA